MIEKNPIAIFIEELVKNSDLTKDKICVACDIPSDTLKSCFRRNRFSRSIRRELFHNGFINEDHLKEYDEWIKRLGD